MNSKNSSLYTLWSLAILFCLVLCVFAVFFASCSKSGAGGEESKTGSKVTVETETSLPPETGENTPAESTPEPTPTPTPAPTRLAESADAGEDYVKQFIFLGDSTTYGLKYYAMLPDGSNTTQVWTPASGTLTLDRQSFATIVYPDTGEEITISEAIERKKPAYLMITLGVNGVSYLDQENFVREYTDLVNRVKELSPDTKILCNSIYPVAASYPYIKDINNDKIRQANLWVEQVAADTGTRFLNTFETLVGEDGYLPEAYQNGDGIHLNPDGFTRVLTYLRTHAYA